MPSLSRASLGVIIIGNDRMQPCNFPSFEKKLRVSQTRMIAAINLLAAVVVFISKAKIGICLEKTEAVRVAEREMDGDKDDEFACIFLTFMKRFFQSQFSDHNAKRRFSYFILQ